MGDALDRWPARALIAGYLVLMVIAWSPLPWNMQWSEPFFLAVVAFSIVHRVWRGWRPHLVDAAVVVYVAGGLPSLLASSSPGASLLQLGKQAYLVVVYLLFSRLLTVERLRAWTAQVTAAVAAGCAAAGAVALVLYHAGDHVIGMLGTPLGMPYVGHVFRLSGPFQSFEMFGNFLTFALPLLFATARWASDTARGWWWGALALVAVAAFFVFGHSWAGMAVAVVVWAWPRWRARPLTRITGAAVVVALILMVNAVLIVAIREISVTSGTNSRLGPPPFPYVLQPDGQGPPMTTLAVSYNLMSYFVLKRLALEAFLETPVTGVGLGRFHDVTEQAYQRNPGSEFFERFRRIDPHSTLLGRLAETGLVGGLTLLLLWLAVGALAVGAVRRAGGDWVPAAVAAGLTGLLVNSVNTDIMNFRFLWIGVAVLRGAAKTADA